MLATTTSRIVLQKLIMIVNLDVAIYFFEKESLFAYNKMHSGIGAKVKFRNYLRKRTSGARYHRVDT